MLGAVMLSIVSYAAPYCVPTSTNGTTGGDFINGIALGSINNQNSGSATGTTYNDYTAQTTQISQAASFTITITGGTFATEFYGAWIDYNNDSTFATNEKLGQIQTNTAGQVVTITFTVPAGATLGNKRLRIRSARNTNNMDPCTNYTRGETEDYTVQVIAGGGAGPIAYFGAIQPSITLGNFVDFADSSSFNPTSWQWTFAGGTPATSSVQNPTGISYSAVGCYAVTLTATNANGSNTVTRTCYVIVNPANPYCNTLYSTGCSGINNINAVNITNTTLNNSGSGCNSLSGTAYSIFPASGNTTATLYRGQSYQLNVTSSSTTSSIAAWIDYNMNNVFDSTEYISVANPATQNLAASVIVNIPANAALGNLRMRVRTRANTGGPGGSAIASTQACNSFTGGEAEDYELTIANAPAVAPTANFTANTFTITAGGSVNFTDLSNGLPTSWSWTFTGAATTSSTSQNPSGIVYNTAGCYDVTLVTTNAQGNSTASQICYITVLAPAYCATIHQNNCSAADFISSVAITGTTLLNDSTACDALNGNGYSIWPATGSKTSTLYRTGTYQVKVTVNANRIIGMWLDYNHNTVFDSTEFVSVALNAAANSTSTASFTVPNNAPLGTMGMRIRSRNVTGTLTATDACTLFGSGETEDYTITIATPPQIPPVANFTADSLTVALGQTVNFTDLSTNLPNSWSWTFTGASPQFSTSQNPQNITYNTVGCYPVQLIAVNNFGSDTMIATCFINVVIPPYCIPFYTNNCTAADVINNVTIAGTSINNINTGCNGSALTPAYNNFAPSATTSDTLLQATAYQISVTVNANRLISCWIDYNQNGTFETTEYSTIATNAQANVAATSTLTIPSSALLGETRMRIRSRNVTGTITSADACTQFGSGETEDYTITIGAALQLPPVANFGADSLTIVMGTNVDFNDLSTNTPTSWNWTFTGGVPSTSTVQNPQNIVYSTPGCYPVTLVATNAFGSDTATVICYITVTTPPYCSTLHTNGCGGGNGGGNINTVAIGGTNLNNANTGCTGTPYTIYPATATTTATLNRGTSYNFSVTTTVSQRVGIWIDWNQNYTFEASEFNLVANATPANIQATIAILIPTNALVGNTAMRVRSRSTGGTLTSADACTQFGSGETEDYTLTIGAGGNNAPVASFTSNFTSVSPFGSINFSDNSSNTPTSWEWIFDGANPSSSTAQNPTGIVFGTPGCYDVTLIATNAFGSDTLTESCFINVTTAATFCVPTHTNACTNSYINTVQITGTTLNNALTGCNSVTATAYTQWPATGNTTGQLNRNQSYNLKVTCNTASRISVWIDYNHNNIFETSEWTQVASTSQANVASTVSIFVPSTATAGPTGMRIRSVTSVGGGGGGGGGTVNGATNPCTSFATGESEDYTINIFDPSLLPVANFSANQTTTCAGGNITFTDLSTQNPSVWNWSFPGATPATSNVQNPTVTYTTAGVHPVTLIVISGNGTDTLVQNNYITVNASPAVNAGNNVVICAGASTQLQATGGSGYVWNNAGSLSAANIANPIATPTVTTNYIVSSTALGCVGSDTVMVTVNSATATAGNDVATCAGIPVGISAAGGGTYSWTPTTGLSDATIYNPVANPTATTNYTVTVTNNGCTATDNITVTVNSVTAIASADVAICNGASTPINVQTVGSNNTFVWSPTAGLSNTTVFNPTASPTATTTYSVTVTNTVNGCSATDAVVVTVTNVAANVSANATICNGTSTQLTATGGTTYVWSPATGLSNATIANPIANPTTTTTYNVIATTAGCTATNNVTVTVNTASVTTGSNATICSGSSTPLQAIGFGTFSWSPSSGLSNANVANPTAAPSATTTYTVTNTFNGCTATAQQTITINNVSANASAGNDVSICRDANTTLNASGGASYLWSPALGLSNATIANPVATPHATTIYTVTVTSGNCTATDNVTVTVIGTNATAGLDITVCPTNTAQLAASGGTSYSWMPSTNLSAANIANPIFTAGSTTTYMVTIGNGTCSYTDTLVVNVGVVTANAGNDTTVCNGSSTQLLASGGANYIWTPSTGLSNAAIANPIATPGVTTTYTVVSSSGTCSAFDNVTINVIPAVSANAGADVALCLGDTLQLTATGGSSYTWTPSNNLSATNIANPMAYPGTTTTYMVTVSNGACSDMDTVTITIQTLTVTASATANALCAGTNAQLGASATGTVGYTWSPAIGLDNATIANPTATPTATTTYMVTASDGVCTVTDNVSITVNSLPNAQITSSGATSICQGQTIPNFCINGAVGDIYLWNNGVSTLCVTPTANGCFSAVVTDANGCSANTDTICFNENALPTTPVITIANDGSIGTSVIAVAYLWTLDSTPISNTTQSITPTSNGLYTVTAVSDSGCASATSVSFNYIFTNITAAGTQEFISVYPNPAKDVININATFENATDIQIVLKDITGRNIEVFETSTATKTMLKQFDISAQPAGMYFVTINAGNKVFTKKLVH